VIEKSAANKGYLAADTLVKCHEFDLLGVKTYIPEPSLQRRWTDKTEEQKRPCSAIEPALSGPTANDFNASEASWSSVRSPTSATRAVGVAVGYVASPTFASDT
jgi:hypothetical protein